MTADLSPDLYPWTVRTDKRWVVDEHMEVIEVSRYVRCKGKCSFRPDGPQPVDRISWRHSAGGHTAPKHAQKCLDRTLYLGTEEAAEAARRAKIEEAAKSDAVRLLCDAERAFLIVHGWKEIEDPETGPTGNWDPPKGYPGPRKERNLSHAINSIRYHVYGAWKSSFGGRMR